MARRLVLAAALVLAAILPSRSGSATERVLLEKWCAEGSAAASGRCFGYLLAVEDAMRRGPVEGLRACLPAVLPLAEQHRAVAEWLRAHPRLADISALELVARAYAERYPCGG